MDVAVKTCQSRAQLIQAGLVAFLASCTAVGIASWYVDAMPQGTARAVALGFFLFTPPFLVLAHEFGHFSVAKLLGWRVPLFSWGPLTLRCSPLRLIVGAPAFGGNTAGAVVAVSPPGRDSHWAWAAVYAGGPAVNILLALAGLYAAHRAASDSTAESLYLVFAAISGSTAFYNLMAGGSSDGSQIRNILRYRNGPLRGQRARLVEQAINGVRPRDLPQPLIGAILRESLWSDDPDVQLAASAWHMDRGDMASARSALSRSASDERILAEQAFLSASVDGDAATARALLARTHSWAIHGQTCYWRAEAATAAAEGQMMKAREAIRKGRILCREWPYATAFDAECFDAIELRLER